MTGNSCISPTRPLSKPRTAACRLGNRYSCKCSGHLRSARCVSCCQHIFRWYQCLAAQQHAPISRSKVTALFQAVTGAGHAAGRSVSPHLKSSWICQLVWADSPTPVHDCPRQQLPHKVPLSAAEHCSGSCCYESLTASDGQISASQSVLSQVPANRCSTFACFKASNDGSYSISSCTRAGT